LNFRQSGREEPETSKARTYGVFCFLISLNYFSHIDPLLNRLIKHIITKNFMCQGCTTPAG
jgi:hypothetical protein